MKDELEKKGADPEDDPKDNPELDKNKDDDEFQTRPLPGTGSNGNLRNDTCSSQRHERYQRLRNKFGGQYIG